MEERGGARFTLGFVVGALVGGAVAMLLVPWWGEDSRELLRARAREASNLAKDKLADLSDEARSAAAEGATNLGDAYARGAEVVEEVRRGVDDAVQEGRDAAAEHRADLQQRYLAEGSAP